MKVEECKINDAITCKPTDKIQSAAALLKKHNLRHLYVTSGDGQLLGLFAASDVVYEVMSEGKDYREMNVEDMMHKDIKSFNKNDEVTTPIGFMAKTNIMSVPIVQENKIVGVLSYKDAVTKVLERKKQ